MEYKLLRPFGVEISDIDITTMLASNYQQISQLVSRNRVAVLKNQKLSDIAFVRFLEGFGELMFTAGEVPVKTAPMLNVVTNVGRSSPPKSAFHTDTSYLLQPPSFSALRPVLLPKSGGNTVFSDQVNALHRLPKKVIRFLSGRTVLHTVSQLTGQSAAARHPLFRQHPSTGEIALYLSNLPRCSMLSGVDEVTSARILAVLYRHSIKARFLYHHQWNEGDILLWDNRVTMHRAEHSDVAENRTLHRGMVQGETPIPFIV